MSNSDNDYLAKVHAGDNKPSEKVEKKTATKKAAPKKKSTKKKSSK